MGPEEEMRGYASSPCMMHEMSEIDPPDADDVQLYYLYIDEQRGAFRWQLRVHERAEPLEIGRETYESEHEAQDAGRRAFDRFCANLRRHGGPM